MNQWYFDIGLLFVIFLLIVGIIVCVISLIIKLIKKKNRKAVIIAVCIHFVLLTVSILYGFSHSTYYKYNDWVILNRNIHMIEEKYGEFDLGEIKEGEKGSVAYYIYTDNGPIMPDHLKHYYYMKYDEWGMIYNVFDGLQPGG